MSKENLKEEEQKIPFYKNIKILGKVALIVIVLGLIYSFFAESMFLFLTMGFSMTMTPMVVYVVLNVVIKSATDYNPSKDDETLIFSQVFLFSVLVGVIGAAMTDDIIMNGKY